MVVAPTIKRVNSVCGKERSRRSMQYVARGAPGTTVYDHLSTASRSSGTTITTMCSKQQHVITNKPSGLPLAAARARLQHGLQPMHACVTFAHGCKFRFEPEVEGAHTFFDGTQTYKSNRCGLTARERGTVAGEVDTALDGCEGGRSLARGREVKGEVGGRGH